VAVGAAAGVPLSAGAAEWKGEGPEWLIGTNWTENVVPGAGETALFPSSVSDVRPVLDGPASVGGLVIDNQIFPYELTGTGGLSLGAGGIRLTGSGGALIDVPLTVAAPQTWTVDSESTLVLARPLAGVRPITFAGGGVADFEIGTNSFAGGLVVNSGTVTTTLGTDSPSRVFRSNRITLGAEGSLVVQNAGSLDIGQVDGSGTLDTAGGGLFMFALADATFSGALKIGSSSQGLTLRGIATQTLTGDTTLDGAVDFADLVRLAQSYDVTDGSRVWATGDFDYDGNVDFADLVKLAQNYETALGGAPAVPAGASPAFAADLAMAFAAVPEPGTGAALIAGAVGALLRRRRSSRRGAGHN
jgi:hypothetical protein